MIRNAYQRTSAIIALCVLLAACNSDSTNSNSHQTTVNQTDQTFIVGATQASNAEIGAANIALTKTANADVIAFAKEMIAQHTQQEQALAPIGVAVNSPPPPMTSLNPMQQAQAAALQATPEPAFDGLYINGEIAGHTANVTNNFQPELAGGYNNQVVQFATTYLPQVQMHLQMASSIKVKYAF